MRWRITHVRGGGGWAHYEKSGTLQKKVTHYKKLVPETCNLVPETRNKNQCYCRPPHLASVLVKFRLIFVAMYEIIQFSITTVDEGNHLFWSFTWLNTGQWLDSCRVR